MAAPKKGGTSSTTKLQRQKIKKKTTIGHSKNTRLKSKNDKRQKKLYNRQGR